MDETIQTVFKDIQKISNPLLFDCPKLPATKNTFFDFLAHSKLSSVLHKTGLHRPLFLFLQDYKWYQKNFCYSRDTLERKWHMGHRAVTKYLLCFFFLGWIRPHCKWTWANPKAHGWTPVWILTDKLFSATPDNIKLWAEKLGIGRGRYMRKTTPH